MADYRFYLEKLQAVANKYRCEIHAYVPMTSHVHRLLTPHTEDGIGKLIKCWGATSQKSIESESKPGSCRRVG